MPGTHPPGQRAQVILPLALGAGVEKEKIEPEPSATAVRLGIDVRVPGDDRRHTDLGGRGVQRDFELDVLA